jgi:ArsR family transcriptional regulator, arsenate/arsenite/antimonite-responsive transcriptional repressor
MVTTLVREMSPPAVETEIAVERVSRVTPEKLGLHPLPKASAERLVRWFKLFSDETRVRIVHYLTQCKELNVRTLCELLDQSQPAVSHHLALLKEEHLVEIRRDGKHNFYRLIPKEFEGFAGELFSLSPNPHRIVLPTAVLNMVDQAP